MEIQKESPSHYIKLEVWWYLNELLLNSCKYSMNMSNGISVLPRFSIVSGWPMIVPPYKVDTRNKEQWIPMFINKNYVAICLPPNRMKTNHSCYRPSSSTKLNEGRTTKVCCRWQRCEHQMVKTRSEGNREPFSTQ